MVTLSQLHDALLERGIVYRYRPEQLAELEARHLGLGSQPPRRSVITRYGPMVEEVIPPTWEPAYVSPSDWSKAERLCQAWDAFFRLAYRWYVDGRNGANGNGCFSLIGTGLERERCTLYPGYPSLMPFVRFDCVERPDGSLVVIDVNSSRPIGAAHTEALGWLFRDLGLAEAEPPPFSRAIADHLIECYSAWCQSHGRSVEPPNLAIVIPEHLGSVPDFEVLRQFLIQDQRFASVELVDPNDLRCSSAPKRLERHTPGGWQPVDLVLRTIKPDLDPLIAPALVDAYPDAACITSPLYRRWLGSKFWFYLL